MKILGVKIESGFEENENRRRCCLSLKNQRLQKEKSDKVKVAHMYNDNQWNIHQIRISFDRRCTLHILRR